MLTAFLSAIGLGVFIWMVIELATAKEVKEEEPKNDNQ